MMYCLPFILIFSTLYSFGENAIFLKNDFKEMELGKHCTHLIGSKNICTIQNLLINNLKKIFWC